MLMLMEDRSVRRAGLALAMCYASFIVWLYVRQPQTLAEVTGGLTATSAPTESISRRSTMASELFRHEQFEAARAAFERADPAGQDARTQFYIAYSYYRSGWGRVVPGRRAFQDGARPCDKAIELAPERRLVVDDPETAHAQRRRVEGRAGRRAAHRGVRLQPDARLQEAEMKAATEAVYLPMLFLTVRCSAG